MADCEVVAVHAGRSGSEEQPNGNVVFSRQRLAREEGEEGEAALWCWSCNGATPGVAMTVAADPTEGLLQQLGLRPALAIVGVNREDGFHHLGGRRETTVDVARQAALLGVPTVAAILPSGARGGNGETEAEDDMALAQEALETVLRELVQNILLDAGQTLKPPANR